MHPASRRQGYALKERPMRYFVQPSRLLVGFAFVVAVIANSVSAQTLHPMESRLRRDFPAVALGSASTTFESTEATANGRIVSGLRAHFAAAALPKGLSP